VQLGTERFDSMRLLKLFEFSKGRSSSDGLEVAEAGLNLYD
jgi:hypothetical protein